jgi:spore coat protein CotH
VKTHFVRHTTACVAILGCLLLGPTARAQAPKKLADPVAEFFKSGKVVEINIEIGTKEMDSLRRQDRTYVRTKLIEDGKTTYTDVGVHLRGAAGSYRGIDDKAGLTVNMDKFMDDQRFHGMDKFHLANSLQDPSYVSELICGEIFRAAGVPASRVGHAIVSINGRRRGMYYLKEGYDTQFLKTHFGNADGNLYDGGFLREIDQQPRVISSKNDVKDYADLKALMAAAQERDPAKRFEKLEKLLELDKFISYLVLETIMWDWDGYPMKRNNYRMYHDPKKDKITFIPSGLDQMFADTNGPILPHFEGTIARALIETPKGKERYYARMAEIMKTVFKPTELVKRLDEVEAVVKPALTKIDAGAGRDYSNHVNRLKQPFPSGPRASRSS